jgi:hypothetical protein
MGGRGSDRVFMLHGARIENETRFKGLRPSFKLECGFNVQFCGVLIPLIDFYLIYLRKKSARFKVTRTKNTETKDKSQYTNTKVNNNKEERRTIIVSIFISHFASIYIKVEVG